MLSLSVAPSAWSATIRTVDDFDPLADHSTIQAAINVAADGDEIEVWPGTYTSTGAVVVNLMGKAITVRSRDGADVTIIDGQNVRRCVVAQLNEESDTVLKGFKIYRGRNAVGAGMYVSNSSPTIEECKFQGCEAAGGTASGGGLRLVASNAVVRDCEFFSNSAITGGGMSNGGGAISVVDCTFYLNTACYGNSVYTLDDDARFSGCVFRDSNSPCGGARGGGLAAVSSRCIVDQCLFSNNVIDDSCRNYGGGACVWGEGALVTFNTCEFLSNRAACNGTGAALAIGVGGDERGSVTANNCRFAFNFSDYDGGAIAFQSNGTLTLDKCVFESNSSNRFGGAICVNPFDFDSSGNVLIDDSKFRDNSAGSKGGALWVRQNASAQRTITDSVFISNIAPFGGGLFLEGVTTPLRLGGCAFCQNDPADFQGQVLEVVPNCFTDSCVDDDGDGFPNTCPPPVETDCNRNGIDDDEELIGNDINNDGIPDAICQDGMNFAGLVTEIRPITDMISGLPTTAVTWRVYATFSGKLAANASVTTIYGNAEYPLLISSASGFYQSATGGNTGEDIACNSSDASLLYDSFFTIAAECFDIEFDLQVTSGFSFSSFNETTNASLSTSNGAIYVLPGTPASLAGADFRVLLMQLTTKAAVKPTALINLLGDNGMDVDDNEWWAYALPIPDPALVDCNENQVHDAIDIALGTVRDCDLNGVPDSCSGGDLSVDCDGDGVPDACEIRLGTATDTDSDGIPDNCQCQGDVDHNGAVNVDDLLEIFIAWGDSNPGEADLNGDGEVNSADLVLVLDGWGTCL